MDREEYTKRKIEQLEVMTDERKEYILEYKYLAKIRRYLELEYGECGENPIMFNELCSDFGDSEEYNSEIAFHVNFKQGYIFNTIGFRVYYKFSTVKKSGEEWESFNAYRESDNVYITFPEQKSEGGIYRSEYKRKWQDGGLSKVFTNREIEEFYNSES